MTTSYSLPRSNPRVSVVVPCLNEEASIGDVVRQFKEVLPEARVVVVDNGSNDSTAQVARAAGADVIRETRRGKGFALLSGLRRASPADVFVMVDGDGTYAATDAAQLLARIEDGADMAIGTRLEAAATGSFPPGHSIGNRLFIWLVRLLFGIKTRDLFSGYRALTARMLLQAPLIAQGFDIEAELSIQAFVNRFRVDEVPISYRPRHAESSSKLRTIHDGYRILIAILAFFRDYRPLTFFGTAASLLFLLSMLAGTLVVQQYIETGQVLRIPMAVLAAGLFILSSMSMTAGVLLSSINRRSEQLRALIVSKWN